MEMGSCSTPTLASAGASDSSSLKGLQFGKKTYFEDVSSGKLLSGVGGGGSTRKGKGTLHPRCLVEGCKVDLTDAKPYYSRHKVCGAHSKSPKVIVAGLEQRFCQQCSRFHQLSEFDQGKRSCRRRLAGHNERRRKPQPGSLFSSRYGRLSSSLQESSSRVEGFLMDFTTYPRLPGRNVWSNVRTDNGNQSTAMGKLLPHQWQGILENPPANMFSQASHPYLQGSTGGTFFSSSRTPSGECFTGVSDSGCALSLLSNQPWVPKHQQSGLLVNNLINGEGASMAQSIEPHSATASFTSNAWNFKSDEAIGTSQEMPCEFGLGQVSEPINSRIPSELELAQPGDRQFMELPHSRAYVSSSHQMHWSL